MKNKKIKIISALIFIVILSLMIFTGCKSNETPLTSDNPSQSLEVSSADAEEAEDNQLPDEESSSDEGETVSFALSVVYADGEEETFNIETMEETVGAALLKEGIIEGEDGPYGLYVKSVNDVRADFDKDGTYWAFYVNGKFATTGVDSTKIKDGEEYMFKIEK